jgi:uncharacterized membrane protein YeaQ/YmgE (transglycosylase-associated protein family)
MGYIAVAYLFGIVSVVIAYYIFKKYGAGFGKALSVVFGVIGALVLIFSVVLTIVMITDHRSY